MIDRNIPDDPPRDPFAALDALQASMGLHHYILDGRKLKPVGMMEWALWLERKDNPRQIECGHVGPVRVSTILLGIDHSHGLGPPLFFETMVFGGLKFDLGQWRWSTYDDAEAGHAAIVAKMEAHYSRWWMHAWEAAARWTMEAWQHSIDEDDWDWSTHRWTLNQGTDEVRTARATHRWEWWQKQRASAPTAGSGCRSPSSSTADSTSSGAES